MLKNKQLHVVYTKMTKLECWKPSYKLRKPSYKPRMLNEKLLQRWDHSQTQLDPCVCIHCLTLRINTCVTWNLVPSPDLPKDRIGLGTGDSTLFSTVQPCRDLHVSSLTKSRICCLPTVHLRVVYPHSRDLLSWIVMRHIEFIMYE